MKFLLQFGYLFNIVVFAWIEEFKICQHVKKVSFTLIVYALSIYRKIYKYNFFVCLFCWSIMSLYFCCILSVFLLKLDLKPTINSKI